MSVEIPTQATRDPVEILRDVGQREPNGRGTLLCRFISFMLETEAGPELRASAFENARSNRGDMSAEELLTYMNELGAGPEAHVAAAYAGHYASVEITGPPINDPAEAA